MPDYKKMYFQLSARVADAIELLIKAQQQAENDYIESESLIIPLSDNIPEYPDSDSKTIQT